MTREWGRRGGAFAGYVWSSSAGRMKFGWPADLPPFSRSHSFAQAGIFACERELARACGVSQSDGERPRYENGQRAASSPGVSGWRHNTSNPHTLRPKEQLALHLGAGSRVDELGISVRLGYYWRVFGSLPGPADFAADVCFLTYMKADRPWHSRMDSMYFHHCWGCCNSESFRGAARAGDWELVIPRPATRCAHSRAQDISGIESPRALESRVRRWWGNLVLSWGECCARRQIRKGSHHPNNHRCENISEKASSRRKHEIQSSCGWQFYRQKWSYRIVIITACGLR